MTHESKSSASLWLIFSATAYVGVSLIANVMSLRIVTLGSFSIDAGTLSYPLVFTLRDLVHKSGGRSAARMTIVMGAALNLLFVIGVRVAAWLPSDPQMGDAPAQTSAYGAILNNTWRIVAASLIAQVIAEMVDTEAYHQFVRQFGRRFQWGRVAFSNAISIPIDSILFVVIAFGFSWELIQNNILLKLVATAITVPLIYLIPDFSDAEGPKSTRQASVAPGMA